MLINSVFGRNKRTSQARRFGRRDNRRRLIGIGIPVLLVGVLAGVYFLNSYAAANVNASFQIDLSSIDESYLQTLYSNYSGATSYVTTKPLFRITSVFYKYDNNFDWGTSVYTDITQSYGQNGSSNSISIQPGKYYVINTVAVATRENNSVVLATDSAHLKFLVVDYHEIEV